MTKKRLTRSSCSSRSSFSLCSNEDNVSLDLSADVKQQEKCIESDVSFERKFIIAKENITSGGIFFLPHHRRAVLPALYYIDNSQENGSLCEVLKIDEGRRSMFYGESVVADGAILIFSPIHPLFLVIGLLIENAKNSFLSITDLLEHRTFPAFRLLAANPKLLKSLKLVTDYKEVDNILYFFYNSDKLLKWLEKRYEILFQSLLKNGELGNKLLSEETALRRYVFGIFCDFLSEKLDVTLLKKKLQIKDAEQCVALSKVQAPKRRKNNECIDENVSIKKTPQISKAAKKLQQASKGTKSLSAFFAKK